MGKIMSKNSNISVKIDPNFYEYKTDKAATWEATKDEKYIRNGSLCKRRKWSVLLPTTVAKNVYSSQWRCGSVLFRSQTNVSHGEY